MIVSKADYRKAIKQSLCRKEQRKKKHHCYSNFWKALSLMVYTAAQGRHRRGDYIKDEIRSKAGFQ